ncbi:MAG TPA: hypothetical protein VG815_16965 [Chloroflexota bacterium]|nr:hypothetical protein [Chloroflexota bacterium]
MTRTYYPRQEVPRDDRERRWREKMNYLRRLAEMAFFSGDERAERKALMEMVKLLEERKIRNAEPR